MHDDRTREVVERLARHAPDEYLDTEALVPGNAFEERIDESDQHERCRELRVEARALGDAAGDDRRDCRREREKEEEPDEFRLVRWGR